LRHKPLNIKYLTLFSFCSGLEEKVVNLIKQYGGITTLLPNWYNYNYDVGTSNNYILDGGSDMFDTGNKVKPVQVTFKTWSVITKGEHWTRLGLVPDYDKFC